MTLAIEKVVFSGPKGYLSAASGNETVTFQQRGDLMPPDLVRPRPAHPEALGLVSGYGRVLYPRQPLLEAGMYTEEPEGEGATSCF